MKIDHLVYAAPDLAAAIDDLKRCFGVRAAFGGKHVGLGTMERADTAGTVLCWQLTLNALDGGPVPFLIDWGDTETTHDRRHRDSPSTASRSNTPTPPAWPRPSRRSASTCP